MAIVRAPIDMSNVLILGAGASKNICSHFGTGSELLQNIQNRVLDLNLEPEESPNLSDFLNKELFYSRFELEQFHTELLAYRKDRSKNNPSIDAFLDEYAIFPEYEGRRERMINIGKELILAHILGWEGEYIKMEKENTTDPNNWVHHILDFIEAGKGNGVKIVNFNYDRLFEYLFFKHSKLDEETKRQYIQIHTNHVYGRIGDLKEMHPPKPYNGGRPPDPRTFIEFGAQNNERRKDAITNFVTLYGERLYNAEHLRYVRNDFRNVNNIAVMGFGFDKFNLRNIGLDAQHLDPTKNPNRLIHVWLHEIKDKINIEHRRENIAYIRTIYPNIRFYFDSARAFVEEVFRME
jgi:hypothetical protein